MLCSPPSPTEALPRCAMDGSAQGRLCSGMRQLLVADCAQLVNQSFLEEQICAVGLADLKERSPGVYGPATLRCIVAEGGLAQQPEQLASALVHLSRLRIRSYLELGIFSGFTSTLISTYLRRFAPPSSQFHGLAVDVTLQYLSRETRALLHHNSVTAELRRRPLHLAAASRHEHLDLCFIDGDHHARGVLDDFIEFAPSCRLCMFHGALPGLGSPGLWLGGQRCRVQGADHRVQAVVLDRLTLTLTLTRRHC